MKTKTYVIIGLIILFAIGTSWALLREIGREERRLKSSISGVAEVTRAVLASGGDIVRTDRLVLLLVDPKTRRPVALRTESPLVPPMTIRIGQEDVRDGRKLSGAYLVVGITDKDGEIFRVTPGEVYGRSAGPVALGTETFKLLLDQPYRGGLFNETGPTAASAPSAPAGRQPQGRTPMAGISADPRFSISGTITVSKALASSIQPSDRLIILMFDPDTPRPVGFKIIPHALLPQRFTVTLQPEARGALKPAYGLRILTDKDNNPFGSTEGEVIGRSGRPIALGTTGLNFVLDQKYVR